MMAQPMRPEDIPQICSTKTGEPDDEAALAYYAEVIGDTSQFMWRELGFYKYEQ